MFETITSKQNKLVKHLGKLRLNRAYRYACGTVLVEGKKLVAELSTTTDVIHVLATDKKLLPRTVHISKAFLVNEDILKKISGLEHPEGIVAEVRMPSTPFPERCTHLIALDGISDPGNMGTILRTALALGWEGVFLFNNCCDPYNDKALRAAKGATFKIPLCSGTWEDLELFIKKNSLTPIAADIAGKPADQAKIPKNTALVLGSEAHGLSQETRRACQTISIPMAPGMESLNVSVAGGILMYLLRS